MPWLHLAMTQVCSHDVGTNLLYIVHAGVGMPQKYAANNLTELAELEQVVNACMLLVVAIALNLV